jgi:hypothetical protein
VAGNSPWERVVERRFCDLLESICGLMTRVSMDVSLGQGYPTHNLSSQCCFREALESSALCLNFL